MTAATGGNGDDRDLPHPGSSGGDPARPWSDHDFWAMARRVRQAAEEELAEIEYETERAERKREDMTARAMRAMMEGERWQVLAGARMTEGIVVHTGMDFIGLQDRAGNLHDVAERAIALIRVTSVDARAGRAPTTRRPATFRARLLGLEQARPVELNGMTGLWSLAGTIESVNSDHLVLIEANGFSSIVPLDAIATVSRPAPAHRRAGSSEPSRRQPGH